MTDLDDKNLAQIVSQLTPEQLSSKAGKALARRLIRTNYEAWCRFALKPRGETPALHHKLIIENLEAITRGELKNLIVLMPPGSAKSTYISQLFTPWHLNPSQRPSDLILACSYSYTLIEGFGRQCRDYIDLHQEVLGYGLSATASAAGDWRTTLGGGYFCAGVGSGIAGHRADLGFIDDFLGSEEDANSEKTREKQWLWYLNDFSPRLKPNAATIIIANRRHEDDLVGRIIATEGQNWKVVKIPFDAEDNDPLGRKKGDPLWPEWFMMNDEAQKKVARARANRLTWSGLYQQNPTPDEGNFFKKEWIKEYEPDELPKDLRIYAGSDWALRKDDLNDWTCHLPGGIDPSGMLWILPDWFWEKCDTLEATNAMFDMQRRRRPITWWHGRENITGSIGPFIYQKMRESNVFIPIEELSEGRSKEQKAQAIKARMMAGMVRFPKRGANWSAAIEQMLKFPNGSNDDFVDALAKLGQGLDMMVPASKTVDNSWDGQLRMEPITLKTVIRSHKRQLAMRN